MKHFNVTLTLFFILGIQLSLFAYQGNTKKIHKQIEVNPNVLIEIQNQFGNLNLSSWDKNEVVIDVEISVTGKNEKKIQEKLDGINIDFDLNPDHVSAQTTINESWASKWFSTSKLQYTINYMVKLPSKSSVDLTNDYGSIVINSLEGTAQIRCNFGKLILGELHADNNELSFDYTTNSTIDYMKGGIINADFSSFELLEGDAISMKADYTIAHITKLNTLSFNNEFGELTLDSIANLKGNGEYLTIKIGALAESMDIINEFGSTRIDQVLPTANSLQIDSEYTGIRIGFHPDWSFDYEVDLEFSKLKGNLELNHLIKRDDGFERFYQGYVGQANSGNNVQITAEFGSVKFD